MQSLSRRGLLQQFSALTAGGLVAAELWSASAASIAEPHIAFPGAPRDRIAAASYPFRAYIDSTDNGDRDPKLPGMSLAQFATEVVNKFDVHNIEPHSNHFGSLDVGYLAGLRDAWQKARVNAVNIAVSITDSFYDAEAATRSKAIAVAKRWIDVAVTIGSPSIRTHIHSADNSPPNVERNAESLREVADYAAAKNVVVHLENDDLVSEDAFYVVKVIEAVHHPYLRALPDFANSMLTGDADFNYRALHAMFQRAYGICHVKDGEVDKGKQYNIDLKRSFDILKASGFRGYCSMEFDASGDPYAATAKLIEQTIRYLS